MGGSEQSNINISVAAHEKYLVCVDNFDYCTDCGLCWINSEHTTVIGHGIDISYRIDCNIDKRVAAVNKTALASSIKLVERYFPLPIKCACPNNKLKK